jgi:hypothetical protein
MQQNKITKQPKSKTIAVEEVIAENVGKLHQKLPEKSTGDSVSGHL